MRGLSSLLWLATVVVLATAGSACRADERPFEVTRHEAEIAVQPDGSLIVTETLHVAATAGTGLIQRRIASERADGLRLISASLDGRSLHSDGTSSPGFDLAEDGELRASWSVPSGDAGATSAPGQHTLGLQYRVSAATEVLRDRGRVVWPVLPAARPFSVVESRVSLALPDGVQWLRGTGIAEAGWTVESTPRGIVATHPNVGRAPATLLAEFAIGRDVIVLPEWQVTADLRAEFALAFLTGAAFVVVIGVGVLWLVAFQYRTGRPAAPAPDAAEPQPAKAAATADLPPDLGAALRTRRFDVGAATTRELIDRGLIDRERLSVAHGFLTTAWAGALFAVACAIVAELTLGRFGWWAQAIPLTLLVMSGAFFVAGRRFQVLTPAGLAFLRSRR